MFPEVRQPANHTQRWLLVVPILLCVGLFFSAAPAPALYAQTAPAQPTATETIFLPVITAAQVVPQPCVADPPGDADDLPDALILCSGQTVTGAVHRDTDRLDVYKIYIERGQHIELLLDASGDGNVELLLSPPDSPPIGETGTIRVSAASMRPDNQEKIDYIARESGYWFVTVYSAAGQNDYSLAVTIPDEPPAGDFAIRGITCGNFPTASSPGWYDQRCRPGGFEYQITRINVSFTKAWHYPPILEPPHFALEVSAYLVQGDADYRLFLFEEDNWGPGYYAFGVRPRDGAFSMMRIDRADGVDTWTPLIDWTPSPHIRRGTLTNRLRIERNGAEWTLIVNGQQVGAVTDDTHGGTEFGLYTRNTEPNSIIRFENMQYVRYSDPGTYSSVAAGDNGAAEAYLLQLE